MNSIQFKLENSPICEAREYFVEHGASLDSIMHKLSIYNYRAKNPNFIHESDKNVYLTLEEQVAARDFFLCVASQYERSIYVDFCNEHNIELDVDMINESVKDFLNKLSDAVKNVPEKTKEAFNKVKDKVSEIKEFIKNLMSNSIKTAKDIFENLTNMFIKFGSGLKGIVEKFTEDNIDEIKDQYFEAVDAAYKDQSKSKNADNIYESLGNYISGKEYNEELINEAFGLFKKKKKENEPDSKDTKSKKGNVYTDAAQNKGDGKKKGGFWAAIGKALLNMAAYYAVTVVIPLIIMIACPVPGVGIATIVHYVGAGVWGTVGIIKQIKQIRTVIKSGQFKQRGKFHKVITIIWWLLMLACQGSAILKAGKGLAEVAQHLTEGGTLATILPPEVLQKALNWFNNLVKEWTGNPNNLPAVDHINKVLEGEQIKEWERAMEEFKNNGGDIENMGEFNNWDKLEEVLPKESVDKLKSIADMPKEEVLKYGDKLNWKTYQAIMKDMQGSLDTGNQIVVVTDNAKRSIDRLNDLNAHGDGLGVNVTHQQYAINAIRDATHGNQGIAQTLVIDMAPTPENIEKVQQLLGDNMYAVLSKPNSLVDTVKEIPHIVGNFIPFAGIWPSVTKFVKGPFKLRLGSGRTYYYPYLIPGEEGILKVPYNKFIDEYKDKNPKAIAEVKKYVDQNLKLAEEYKKMLEEKKKLSKDEKKDHKKVIKYLENAKEGKAEWEVIIFCTNDETADKDVEKSSKRSKKEDSTNESLITEASKAKYPVMFFCPMLMCFGDLARRRKTKPKRSHIYLFKGLLSRIEILPVKEGMSGNEVMKFIIDIAKRSLDSNYNIVFDKPCFKKDGEYVENTESPTKGKERMDFGGFTNEQITKFMNNNDAIADYIGGDHATDTISGGKHKYIEKKSENRKEFVNLLTKNDEIKEYVDKELPSVKKHLYDSDGNLNEKEFDKILPILQRTEKSYLGTSENKKGFLSKLKSLFNKDEESEKSKIKPEELKKFVLKVAEVRTNNLKKKANEDVEVENDEPTISLIAEANMEIISTIDFDEI
jgi:hypothetical protein